MAAGLYRRYLRLLEKWPADPTKQSRDLGKFLRDQIKLTFTAGELSSPVDQEKCLKTYETLNKIADNHYFEKYKRTLSSSATGLTPEQCKAVLSDDFLEFLKEDDESFITKVFKR